MTTPAMTTSRAGGQGEVVRDNPLTTRENDHLTTDHPPFLTIPTAYAMGGYREGGEVGRGGQPPVWLHGTGGRCAEQFAATRAKMDADIKRLGMAGALEHWDETGFIGPAIRQVLTDSDIRAMQRAVDGGRA